MQFFQWTTDYMLYQRQFPKKERMPYEEFLKQRLKTIKSYRMPTVRHDADILWVKEGQPYYNIHPKMAQKLCKVDLNKIPSTMLKTPHGLSVVNIRFAQQHPEFTVADAQMPDMKLPFAQAIPAGSFVHSMLMMRSDYERWNVMFLLDFGTINPNGQPSYCIYGMRLHSAISMEDAIFLASRESSTPDDSYQQMLRNIIRLAVSIGFLADNPAICEADVLADDRGAFREASDEKREFIAARARRRGKYGFNIGTDLMFLGERPKGERRDSIATGRELEYAHIRAGHPHAVRYGESKRLVKIMWYVPTTVRDDLPFKADE